MGCVGRGSDERMKKQNISKRSGKNLFLVNHLCLFDTFFVFPEMMLLRAWERMCNVCSVGYQALKLYGPAHPDFD